MDVVVPAAAEVKEAISALEDAAALAVLVDEGVCDASYVWDVFAER